MVEPDTPIVLDTNIIVSSALNRLGAPARIVTAWEMGRFELVLSTDLLREYERVLLYDGVMRRHKQTVGAVRQLVENFRRGARLVEPDVVPPVIAADPKDDMVLACALAGQADYIVSGDPHLLDLGQYEGIRIVSPAAFVSILGDA
jgi:putative PIN family toxin of toxin-antitoxin system